MQCHDLATLAEKQCKHGVARLSTRGSGATLYHMFVCVTFFQHKKLRECAAHTCFHNNIALTLADGGPHVVPGPEAPDAAVGVELPVVRPGLTDEEALPAGRVEADRCGGSSETQGHDAT